MPQASLNLPRPVFPNEPLPALRMTAGLRPRRATRFCLEAETVSPTKYLIHNYGHGGAGITMSWGCAYEVLDLIKKKIGAAASPGAHPIAVIGAGVMGLTVATLIAEAGFPVRIMADKISKKSAPDQDLGTRPTSDIAGGQWAPSIVNASGVSDLFLRVMVRAKKEHENRGAYGVSAVSNYTPNRHQEYDDLNRLYRQSPYYDGHNDLVPVSSVPVKPFDGLDQQCFEYKTLIVEPPIFMPKLMDGLRALGVVPQQQKLTRNDIVQLPESIVVNCTGLGGKALFPGDAFAMEAIKGELVLLAPQDLGYLLSGLAHIGYLFPRKDALVLGGTADPNVTTIPPDQSHGVAIVQKVRAFFEPTLVADLETPDWHWSGQSFA